MLPPRCSLPTLLLFVLTALLGTASWLRAQPRPPTADQLAQLARLERAAGPRALAAAPVLSVDTSSREAVRQFYLAICTAGDDTALGWTGSYSSGDSGAASVAGTTAAAFKDAVVLRINALRALAGVPAGITLLDTYSVKDQQAALMMSVNNALSHNPPSSWLCYTTDGAAAAGNSNLAIGNSGPRAITFGYIADPGSNNAAAGHRRWLLYPQTQLMGTGDVPASGSFNTANATWVIDSHFSDPRPTTRTPYVAWPAAGYMPAPLIFPRWSFSYPGADFSHATVTLTRDGATVATVLETLSPGAGENTLVWVYGGLDSNTTATPAVTTDSVFHVVVGNVVINGSAQSFTYDVTAFDPARTASDTVPVTVSGSATPAVGAAATYTTTRPSFADTLQWRTLTLDASLTTYNAESGLSGLIPETTGTYSVRTTAQGDVGAGTAGFQLALDGFQDQYLLVPDTFYAPAGGTPQLTFLSRLGLATTDQVARVQISTNDGVSWSDLYTQAGATNNAPTESAFVARTLSLSSVAGLTFKLRFAYTFDTGAAFTQSNAGIGWFLDNIAVSGVQHVATTGSIVATTATSFAFTPSDTATVGLQARGEFFGTYPMGWGPVLVLNPTASIPINIATQPAAQTVSPGGTLTLTVAATSTAPLSYQWYKDGSALSGATSATYTVASASHYDAGNYYVVVSNSSSSVASATVAVTVPTGSTLVNISTRAYCSTGNNVTIGGFVVDGSAAKKVLIRAVGPSLTNSGIGATEVLADPHVSVYRYTNGAFALFASNDNWTDNSAAIAALATQVGAQAFLASDTTSSGLILTLPPGVYSFIVGGNNNTSGIVLLEVYDADTGTPGSKFVNISCRADCTTGNGVAIGGFVISGTTAKRVLLRAVGPTLTSQGLGTAELLANPTISLYQLSNGAFVPFASNDDWGTNANAAASASAAAAVGATPFLSSDTKSSALLLALQPGVYSFIAGGTNNTTGIALIEVYDAD